MSSMGPWTTGLGFLIEVGQETTELATIKATITGHGQVGQPADYAASRGEYLNGKIMAALLGWRFIDATEVIFDLSP